MYVPPILSRPNTSKRKHADRILSGSTGMPKKVGANTVTTCTAWENNGTATFGESYAATLKDGRLYHMVINYEVQDDGTKASSESDVFRMINPLPLPESTTSPSTTSNPTQTQTGASSQSSSQSKQPSTSRSSGPYSSSKTSTSTSISPPSSTSAASGTTSPSPTSTSTSKSSELTPGAKVGITVGVLAFVITIFFAAFFYHRKRQAKKTALADQRRDQQANRSTAVNLDDIDITFGSPVTYDRVYEGRGGWHQRSLPPIFVPGRTSGTVQSQRELYGSPF